MYLHAGAFQSRMPWTLNHIKYDKIVFSSYKLNQSREEKYERK